MTQKQEIVCKCDANHEGRSCQIDKRPCGSYPCLNNGVCSEINNETAFECNCVSSFYGDFCEKQIDLCANSSCISSQGYCVLNGSSTGCKCFLYYSGEKCEIISTSLSVQKAIITLATILAFIILVSFIFTVLIMDYTKYFLMKSSIKKPIKYKIEKNFVYYN